VGYGPGRPGVALGEVTDEARLDRILGRYMEVGGHLWSRSEWKRQVEERKWNAVALFFLALNVVHRDRPRSLVVDFRAPPGDDAAARRVSTSDRDVDCAMLAYEILCRAERYSEYRGAAMDLVFTGREGARTFSSEAPGGRPRRS
jgi:hypothetical protein